MLSPPWAGLKKIDAYVTHNPGAENEAVGAALRGVLASLGAQNTVGRR